ncbi:rhomboid family intramembrane serine protease [Ligilactobacillus cholophilus]|uniref:rhomboid family intramembrane serine protease n=1 Tax=Ligilactobacillus cholophilus TaxID=3050131 RepID=UPI003EB86DB1
MNKQSKVTVILIAINIIIFLLMTIDGGSTSANVLISFGAKDNLLIADGQFWRLFTAMFLHIGFQHIVLNMVTLYFLGSQIEYIFGSIRFLIIYLISGIGGNIVSFALSPSISAGASTAIFGLFGAYLALGLEFKQNPYIQTVAKQFFILVILNLISDLSGSIDIWGHIGGLITGFLLAFIVGVPQLGKIKSSKRWLAGITVILLFSVFYSIGLNNIY